MITPPTMATKVPASTPINGRDAQLDVEYGSGVGPQAEEGRVSQREFAAKSRDVPGRGQGNVKEHQGEHVQDEGGFVEQRNHQQGQYK